MYRYIHTYICMYMYLYKPAARCVPIADKSCCMRYMPTVF